MAEITATDRFTGCLLGTALGDSLLLPAEGLSRTVIARRFPGPLRQRLILGRGLISDDTEHTFLLAQALLAGGDDPSRFVRELARRLRWWLIALPGGCGMATAKGLLRSWIGIPPERSGVDSAGNGPAMRSALIGLRWARDRDQRTSFVRASTRLTHTDPRAQAAAQAVADAAAWIVRGDPIEALWQDWRATDCAEWTAVIDLLHQQWEAGADVDAVASALGCPDYVGGFCLHSVPLALFAWLRHRHQPEACLGAILRCGGDTDTIGAIAGALLGCDDGPAVFPRPWIDGVAEWPISCDRLKAIGTALANDQRIPVPWAWPALPLRNLVFLAIILLHVLRRAWPR